jgi:hypothetical protein
MVGLVSPATVVVEPPGTEVVDASDATVVDTGDVDVVADDAVVVLVFAVLGRREGPPAAVVVGASLPLTAVEVEVGAVVDVVFPVSPVAVVVVVVGCFFGSEVTHGMLN